MGSSISGSYSVVFAVVFCVLRLVVFSVSRLVETDVLCDGGGSEGSSSIDLPSSREKKFSPF